MTIFLKIDGVDGNATEQHHKNWFTVHSFSSGFSRSVQTPIGHAANRVAGLPQVFDVQITRATDAATPQLIKLGLSDKAGKLVKIHFLTTGSPARVQYEVELKNCIISNFMQTSSGDLPTETFSLNYTQAVWKFTPTNEKNEIGAPQTASFDLTSGVAS